jgi:hypothetical protein
MLITFIRPNENASPIAISSKIEPMLIALNPWDSQIAKLHLSS